MGSLGIAGCANSFSQGRGPLQGFWHTVAEASKIQHWVPRYGRRRAGHPRFGEYAQGARELEADTSQDPVIADSILQVPFRFDSSPPDFSNNHLNGGRNSGDMAMSTTGVPVVSPGLRNLSALLGCGEVSPLHVHRRR